MKKFSTYLTLTIFCVVTLLGCIESDYTTNPSHRLAFSCDTLSFDTVFNTIPSRTKTLLVINHHAKAIKLDEIRLLNGENSFFRINVDGIKDNEHIINNIDINAKDSIFVFVELTIDEQAENIPVNISDALVFKFNGQQQLLPLRACGQNATIFRHKTIANDTTITSERPFLILNTLHVRQGCTLTIEEGTHIHLHNNANIVVDGHLVANGTTQKPIVIQGDRLDRMNDVDHTPYSYLSGQWGSIYLQNPQGNHSLNHVEIIGGTNGLLLLGTTSQQPTLKLNNSRIHMHSQYGLYAQNGNVTAVNCELTNCGTSCLNIVGGDNNITHCTIANYYEWAVRETPSVAVSNYLVDGNWIYLYHLNSAVFENSIIMGNRAEELLLDKDTISKQSIAYNVFFSHCHIKASANSTPSFNKIIWASAQNNSEVFVNTSITNIKQKGYYDFTLLPNASSRNSANMQVAAKHPTDRNGENRFWDGKPDMGAYERQSN